MIKGFFHKNILLDQGTFLQKRFPLSRKFPTQKILLDQGDFPQKYSDSEIFLTLNAC